MLGLKLDLVLVKVQDRISQYVGLPTCTSLVTMHSLPGGSKIWLHSINQKTAKDAKKRAKQVFRPPKDVCFPAKDRRNLVKTRKGDKKNYAVVIVFSVILLYFMFLHFYFILWAVVSAAYSA